jgi:hypothetical protein
LPHLWFRNIWAWGETRRRGPRSRRVRRGGLDRADRGRFGRRRPPIFRSAMR